MDKKILQDIGLTEGEVKIYLALLRLGESKKSELSKESGVSSSKIYEVADKLQKKGLIGFISKDNVKYFKALEPKRILDFFNEKSSKFDEQKRALEKFIPELESVSKKEETNAILCEGIKAIKNFYINLLEELKSGEEYYVIGVNYGDNLPGVREFFENFHNQRAKKKIKVKMLVNSDAKELLVKSTQKYSEIRFLPQYLLNNMIILFYKNKAFIFFLAKDSVGLIVENREVTKGFRVYFDAFWKIAKPQKF